MSRTACTEPQHLCKGALYLTLYNTGLYDMDIEKFTFYLFHRTPRYKNKKMWTGQKCSVESRNLQSESPTVQSHSVTTQFSLIMVTWLDTVVWNRTKYALTRTWQLRNQCAAWSVCCRSHRHVRLKTQLLSCLLAVTNKTRAADADLHVMQTEYFHSYDTPQFSSILRFQSFSHRCCWIFKSYMRLRRGHWQLPTFRGIILSSSSGATWTDDDHTKRLLS